jgi:hypothetical protein
MATDKQRVVTRHDSSIRAPSAYAIGKDIPKDNPDNMCKDRLTSKRVDTARPPGAHSMTGDRPTAFPQATEARPITGKRLTDELTPQATRRVRGPSCHRQMAHRRVVFPSNTCPTGLRGMTYQSKWLTDE